MDKYTENMHSCKIIISSPFQLVELLLKHGADPLIVNKKGKAPLDLAFSPEIRALMIESCSDNPLLEANSPTSPESLDSAEESSNQGRDTNGETRVPGRYLIGRTLLRIWQCSNHPIDKLPYCIMGNAPIW